MQKSCKQGKGGVSAGICAPSYISIDEWTVIVRMEKQLIVYYEPQGHKGRSLIT